MPRDQSIERTILHRLKIAGAFGYRHRDGRKGPLLHRRGPSIYGRQAALREADHVILKNHMETCVADSIRKGDSDEVIEEVMRVMEKK